MFPSPLSPGSLRLLCAPWSPAVGTTPCGSLGSSLVGDILSPSVTAFAPGPANTVIVTFLTDTSENLSTHCVLFRGPVADVQAFLKAASLLCPLEPVGRMQRSPGGGLGAVFLRDGAPVSSEGNQCCCGGSADGLEDSFRSYKERILCSWVDTPVTASWNLLRCYFIKEVSTGPEWKPAPAPAPRLPNPHTPHSVSEQNPLKDEREESSLWGFLRALTPS